MMPEQVSPSHFPLMQHDPFSHSPEHTASYFHPNPNGWLVNKTIDSTST